MATFMPWQAERRIENNKWIYEAFENTDEIPLYSLGVHFPFADAYIDVEFDSPLEEA